jgi:hypothetical protein
MEFRNIEIYKHFFMSDEWNDFVESKKILTLSISIIWTLFLKHKDFVIICIDFLRHSFRVVDEKKWALAKIKYGF